MMHLFAYSNFSQLDNDPRPEIREQVREIIAKLAERVFNQRLIGLGDQSCGSFCRFDRTGYDSVGRSPRD